MSTLYICNETCSEQTKIKQGRAKRKLLPTRSLITSDEGDRASFSASTNELIKLRRKSQELTKERDEAIASAKTLHRQQHDLYDSFKLLREKYDDMKSELSHILWEFVPNLQIDDVTSFAELGQVNHAVFETPDRISNYEIGQLLGEGQLSDVRLCTHSVTRKQYAVKIIKKQKIFTLVGLKRIRTEVKLLRQLVHPNIVSFVDFIHSPSCLYIFTEVGGKDLFELFEANPSGAGVEVSREIILGIVKPLLYLHNCGICHRDLKPENILLAQSSSCGTMISHRDVRLCDFGQSAIATSNDGMDLSDLCGSPGFFAPEMILNGEQKYNGFSADVWSVGCIMLELTRGHDEFCKLWMASYDFDILQEESKFEQSLRKAISLIGAPPSDDNIAVDMNSFLIELLVLDPAKRLSVCGMLQHSWLQNENTNNNNREPVFGAGDNGAETEIMDGITSALVPPTTSPSKVPLLNGKRNIFRNSFSSRARKHFAGENERGTKIVFNDDMTCSNFETCIESDHNHVEIKLPPIEPEIPSFKMAKRTIIEGMKIVQNFEQASLTS